MNQHTACTVNHRAPQAFQKVRKGILRISSMEHNLLAVPDTNIIIEDIFY